MYPVKQILALKYELYIVAIKDVNYILYKDYINLSQCESGDFAQSKKI